MDIRSRDPGLVVTSDLAAPESGGDMLIIRVLRWTKLIIDLMPDFLNASLC